MLEKTFERQIKEKLQGLNHKQIIFIAWLWAVRALPFLGASRDLSQWREKTRQKITYSLFNALDVSFAFAVGISPHNFEATYHSACEAFKFNDTKLVARVIITAVEVATFTELETNFRSHADELASCVAVFYNLGNKYRINLKDIFINDVECIKSNTLDRFDNNIGIYGEFWNNLHYIFADMGCEYWVDLYQNIFRSGFEINKEDLKRRLSVPKEIQKYGAKAVSDFIEASKILI